MDDRQDLGVPPSGSGLRPNGLSQSALSQAEPLVPNAVLDQVAFAIERARCNGREGPYGGYDYGHNTDFYGPEPEDGRYVVRDFRDVRSATWGAWVHQTHDKDEHEQAYLRLTGRHIAEAAVRAYASAMSAGTAETQSGSGLQPASAVGNAETPQSTPPSSRSSA